MERLNGSSKSRSEEDPDNRSSRVYQVLMTPTPKTTRNQLDANIEDNSCNEQRQEVDEQLVVSSVSSLEFLESNNVESEGDRNQSPDEAENSPLNRGLNLIPTLRFLTDHFDAGGGVSSHFQSTEDCDQRQDDEDHQVYCPNTSRTGQGHHGKDIHNQEAEVEIEQEDAWHEDQDEGEDSPNHPVEAVCQENKGQEMGQNNTYVQNDIHEVNDPEENAEQEQESSLRSTDIETNAPKRPINEVTNQGNVSFGQDGNAVWTEDTSCVSSMKMDATTKEVTTNEQNSVQPGEGNHGEPNTNEQIQQMKEQLPPPLESRDQMKDDNVLTVHDYPLLRYNSSVILKRQLAEDSSYSFVQNISPPPAKYQRMMMAAKAASLTASSSRFPASASSVYPCEVSPIASPFQRQSYNQLAIHPQQSMNYLNETQQDTPPSGNSRRRISSRPSIDIHSVALSSPVTSAAVGGNLNYASSPFFLNHSKGSHFGSNCSIQGCNCCNKVLNYTREEGKTEGRERRKHFSSACSSPLDVSSCLHYPPPLFPPWSPFYVPSGSNNEVTQPFMVSPRVSLGCPPVSSQVNRPRVCCIPSLSSMGFVNQRSTPIVTSRRESNSCSCVECIEKRIKSQHESLNQRSASVAKTGVTANDFPSDVFHCVSDPKRSQSENQCRDYVANASISATVGVDDDKKTDKSSSHSLESMLPSSSRTAFVKDWLDRSTSNFIHQTVSPSVSLPLVPSSQCYDNNVKGNIGESAFPPAVLFYECPNGCGSIPATSIPPCFMNSSPRRILFSSSNPKNIINKDSKGKRNRGKDSK